MVIAAFIFDKIEDVYTNSVGAGIMFLIAFGVSLFDQIMKFSENDFPLFHWGKFFFFAMGLLHLSLIAIAFAESITTLSSFFFSWIFMSIGLFVFIISSDNLRRTRRRVNTKLDVFDSMCFLLSGISFLVLGFYFIGTGIGIDEFDISGLFLFGIFSIFLGGGLTFLSDYRKKRQK